MPSGQATSVIGRQILTGLGRTPLRSVSVCFPPAPELPSRKWGVIIIEGEQATNEWFAIESKTLWKNGVGWRFVANHILVPSPFNMRLIADMYEGGLPLRWNFFT